MPEISCRIALKIEYAGRNFCGSQMQAGVRTVQEDLETALSVFFRCRKERAIKATFSGRTDTGVHALGQIVHFDLSQDYLLRAFPTLAAPAMEGQAALADLLDETILNRISWALNGILKDDVSVTTAKVVPDDFNARFSAIRRTYVYRILNRAQRSALRQDSRYFVPGKLDVDAMKAASESLLGQHDFLAFKSSNADRSSTICNVELARLLNKGEAELEFWISADHFVYNMVRIIVGTLIEVGLGKRAPQALAEALAGKDRHLAGPTAPPWGLCLYSVDYPAKFGLFPRELILDK